MKQLTIIRHAKSSWSDPTQTDFKRPLNRRGLRDAPRMAEVMAARWPAPPDLIVGSPAQRAVTTAGIFAETLGYPVDSIVAEPTIYEASSSTLIQLVENLPDSADHVVLFGHNPGFHELGRRLSADLVDHFPTCCVLDLVFDIEHWNQTQQNSGEVLAHLYPSMFR